MTTSEVPTELLLPACPYCDYSLHGLPAEHRCPECGQPFDRRRCQFGGQSLWQSSQPRQRWIGGLILMLPVLLAWWFIPPDVIRGRLSGPSWIRYGASVVCLLIVAVWLLVLLQRFFLRPQHFVLVSPVGVWLGHRRRRTLIHYPLMQITRADLDSQGLVVLKIDQRDLKLPWFSPTRSEARNCQAHITALMSKQGAARETPST